MQQVIIGDFDALIDRARRLAQSGGRRLLGIAGAPGSGKSTLGGALADALGDAARLVSMDGFHLANSELVRLGRRDRKGAIDTFDGAGYVALLQRLRHSSEPVIYAPEFRREIDEAVAGVVAVPREVPLVITEGNYLLVQDDPWAEVQTLLDDSWYVELGEATRLERLTQRHLGYGMAPDAARAQSLGSDQFNAGVVAATRQHADVMVQLGPARVSEG